MRYAAIKKFSILLVAFISVFSASAHAAGTPCVLGEDQFTELRSIQENSTIDYLERIRSELVVRKKLLHATIDCAVEEATIAQAGLERFSNEDPSLTTLRTQLLGQFANGVSYYRAEETKIDGLGLQGSRLFAQNLKDWREGNYKPAVKDAANLLLWASNQDLLLKARTRMESVKPTIGLAKIVDNQKIQDLWKDAQARFEETLGHNQQATLSLKERQSPDATLNAIKLSLESLSAMYQKLLDISTAFTVTP